MKAAREFFDPRDLPWRPAPGFPAGAFRSATGCLNFEVRYRIAPGP